MKSVSLILAMTVALAGCSKDDEGDELIGTWGYQDCNAIVYIGNNIIDFKEEAKTSETFKGIMDNWTRLYRAVFFRFTETTIYCTQAGGTFNGVIGDYTVSGTNLNITCDSYSGIVKYRLSGKKLDLIFNRASLEMILGGLSDEFYEVDEVEFTMSFKKAD
jgi:hypothetical protein